MRDTWAVGRFNVKQADYIANGAVDSIFLNLIANKEIQLTFYTNTTSLIKMMGWHVLAVHEYTFDNSKWVVRIKDADGNILTISSSRFSFCLIKHMTFINKVGDPTKIQVQVTLKTVGYN